jgi:alkylated DNA repair dioxygenase AlkB
MDLFSKSDKENLLPYDGTVIYYGRIMPLHGAAVYYQRLMETIAWKNDEARIFGKHFITKRKVAWYGDANYSYTYSNTTRVAHLWTPELLALKKLVEEQTGDHFNSCLLNLYPTGDEGMGWHSDDESSLGKDTTIVSLSFGAERKFTFKHKVTKETVSIPLESGSMLVMKGTTQTHWLHKLPPTKTVKTPRINLTFRTMVEM